MHISITTNACTVVCPEHEAETLFMPLLAGLNSKVQSSVSISSEQYAAVLISGEGLDAGQRVLDLTSPLALAGISIFFITSYYADFILVPFSARRTVIRALEDQGFVFDSDDSHGDAGHMTNSGHLSPQVTKVAFDLFPTSPAPTPTTVAELQTQTFAMLQRHDITPSVDEHIELVTCAGVKDSTAVAVANNNAKDNLQLGLAKCLTSHPPPAFLAITLTDLESMSLTLDTRLLSYFHNDGEDLLVGKDGPEQVAITLDLEQLPLESTGIVCGVASRLRDHMAHRTSEVFTMSYLSTTRTGNVIVYRDELSDAMDALKGARD